MDVASLAARHRASQRAAYRGWVGSPGSRVVDLPGVQATINPVAPDRSIPNCVVYEDPAALFAALDELAGLYADAGVRAWTVWVRPEDGDVGARLEAAGHVLDGTPPMMAAVLSELDLEPRRELDLDPDPDWTTVGRLNDLAYGLDGEFARVVAAAAPGEARRWVARVEGQAAGSVVVRTHEGDAYVELVAVTPEARGRGLCSELMRRALREAAEGGCQTTSLEASPMGTPIYERLGYVTLGRLALWERRVRNDSA